MKDVTKQQNNSTTRLVWADLSGHACESSVELRRWSEDLVWWYYSAILESILELSFTAQRDPFTVTLVCGEPRSLRSEAIQRQVGVTGTKGRVTRVHECDLQIAAGKL